MLVADAVRSGHRRHIDPIEFFDEALVARIPQPDPDTTTLARIGARYEADVVGFTLNHMEQRSLGFWVSSHASVKSLDVQLPSRSAELRYRQLKHGASAVRARAHDLPRYLL